MMKKIFLSLTLALSFSSPSFAQQKDDITKISNCLLNSSVEDEGDCLVKYLSGSMSVAGSDWVFLKEQGKMLDPKDLHQIFFEAVEEFPAGCTTLIAFREKAVQTKICAPDSTTGVPQVKVSSYNYTLTEPGTLQLKQIAINSKTSNTAACSLVDISSNEYLICRTVDENNVKLVMSYQKSIRKI